MGDLKFYLVSGGPQAAFIRAFGNFFLAFVSYVGALSSFISQKQNYNGKKKR